MSLWNVGYTVTHTTRSKNPEDNCHVYKQRYKPYKEIYKNNDIYFAKLFRTLLIIFSHPTTSECCLHFLQNHHTKTTKKELFVLQQTSREAHQTTLGQHLLVSNVSYTLATDGEHLRRSRFVSEYLAPVRITEFVFNPMEEIDGLKAS